MSSVAEAASGEAARPFRPLPERPLSPFLAAIFRVPLSGNDNAAHTPEPGPADELDCLRGVLGAQALRDAEARAQEIDTGADRVLIQQGLIDEEAYVRRLAAGCGFAFEDFAAGEAFDTPLRGEGLMQAAETGILPHRRGGRICWLIAPRRYASRRLARLAARHGHLRDRIRLTTTARFNGFLSYHADGLVAQYATAGLRDAWPDLSSAPRPRVPHGWSARLRRFALGLALAAPVGLFPATVIEIVGGLLALWFIAFVTLRAGASLMPPPPAVRLRRLRDNELPIYSVVVALYREAKSVGPLMEAIGAFDYPREKLDVKLVVEPNDLATRAAIARLGAMAHVEVIVATSAAPQTKPKALNCALPFVRGAFVAVFDAEDRPQPLQLRDAIETFRGSGENVVCAQASLCIDNFSDSWLTRMFAAEYAGQFDLFLPGAASLAVPLPLGGSSNHFKTQALRLLRGWDAWNVTEDAELGLRLARFGYRATTFASTTYEEAPARFDAWLRQRTRWMKGWMQTWAAHMRSPRRLWRDAGPRGFIAINLIVGGNVLTALAHPLLLAELALELGSLALHGRSLLMSGPLAHLHVVAIVSGYLASAIVGAVGLSRRGLLRHATALVWTPVYWLALSAAAWRALFQLFTAPYRWEKTEHGLAQSSHFAARQQRAARRQAQAQPQQSGADQR